MKEIIKYILNAFEESVLKWLENEKHKPLTKKDQKIHDFIFGSENEFVDCFKEDFPEYNAYDKAYPNRFEVKYDENLNRIW